MLLAHYGHRFLDAFNRREGTALTPRQFFDQHLFPVLFDDETFLLDSGNTPFGQADKFSAKNPLTETRRRDVKTLFHSKLDEGTPPAGNDVMFGGIALDATASTSGLLTDLALPIVADDAYASWIGAALALCVQGGWCLLVNDDAVLLETFDGWRAYRRFLQETPGRFKGRQLPTWNAHRLAQVLTGGSAERLDVVDTLKPDVSALPTLSWAGLLLALSKHLHTATPTYVYKLGQQNSTIGLVTLDLPKVETIGQWYATLSGTSGPDLDAELRRVYDTAFGFDTACTFGIVGTSAMKPSKIEDFTPGGKSKMPDRGKMDAALFTLYQSWILAMLDPNSQDLNVRAEETAHLLLDFEAAAVGGKMNHKKAVDEALGQTSRRGFVDALTGIIALADANANSDGGATYDALRDLVAATAQDKMSSEQFRLFVTLVRFHVAGLRAKA
ncbi:MAG: hypothetical protein IAE99_00320 [Rhodothermales bacterium]|nr:hypothetical protein [Rhodothermales bacterium]